ncbi:MAG TPA: 2,4-diaminopentanoate dehydrogenase [Halanaerobiales bacterium]|nr:2,4-diaminopentanoate dehydrogenase [Halanaerobiales bacterium]
MSNIKVVSWGLGAMGSGVAKLVNSKKDMELVGAIDKDPEKIGKDLGEIIEEGNLGVDVVEEFDYSKDIADIVVIATSSFTETVFPMIKKSVEAGLNVVTIAEEMAYPQAQNPELAEKINKLAKENNVSVLGTGINPGFVLDTLILAMTGVCQDVEKIKASRINDLSPFGPTVMETQGVGTTPEEFEKGIKEGTIVGHIGFQESVKMIADSLEIDLDEIKETREAIISETHRETDHVTVEPGMVAGCKHIAYGMKDGEEVIVLEHPQQIHPEKEDVDTGDYINIVGDPDINLSIKPEIPGGKGTKAITANMIPPVMEAESGLVTMKDLRVPYFLPKKMME